MRQLSILPATQPPRIDGPAYNEIEKMTEMTAKLRRAIELSRNLKFGEVRMKFADAEELMQSLADGLRTARQLLQQNR